MTASLFALAVTAQATTVVFGIGGTLGFTNGGSQDGPVNVGGGVYLTANPWASGPGGASLTVNSDGYGVDSGNRDNPEIDGNGRDEALILNFSSPVRVTNIELRNFFSCCDDVEFIVDGHNWNGNGSVIGSEFFIYAEDRDADFRVRSVTFDASAVPEPATMLTGGIGLALLAFARRRK